MISADNEGEQLNSSKVITLSRLHSDAAFVKKRLVVSKLICKKGEAQSFIPSLLIGKYDPVRVMKSAMSDKWRAFTSIPYTPNTAIIEEK